MFRSTYKNTLKNLLRSPTLWLILAFLVGICVYHATRTSYLKYLIETGETISDMDPRWVYDYISMHKDGWQQHSYAASCGVSDRVMWQMLKDNPNINTVYLCLDNDEAGQKANKRISDALESKGIKYEILIPVHKDWNEDLIILQEGEEQCPALQL